MKRKIFQRTVPVFVLVLFALIFVRCNDDRDEYYKRPTWLEPPLYDVLKADGKFGKYLEAIDRTAYTSVLKGAGLYTLFAPNDSAFNAWMEKNSYSAVADIPDSIVDRIVAYSICYNNFTFDSLGVDNILKYKSQYYALPYQDPEYNNEWVVDQTAEQAWTPGYNNYKFVPVFMQRYFNMYSPVLTAQDYNIFFPDSRYTGKNVQAGEILRSDIRAQNGIIHEVSSVSLPLDNIDDIARRPENSVFKSLLDTRNYMTGNFLFKIYLSITSPTLLEQLQRRMPGSTINSIYIKGYIGLGYSLNLENVLDEGGGYIPEKAGYTLILPSSEALTEYLNRRVLKYYSPGQTVAPLITKAVLDAHMVPTLVWPANYINTFNVNGDYLNGKGSDGYGYNESGITGATLASNGFVYHSNKAVRSRLFETVYSEIFLNPARSLSENAYYNHFYTSLREELQKCELNGYMSERYTLLVFDDELLKADGLSYNNTDLTFSHSTSGVNAADRINRLLQEHLFMGVNDGTSDSEITSFATAGVSQYEGWNFRVNSYGDPVRYKDNKIQAAGNIEDGTYATVTKIDEEYLNGTVWSVDNMLQYSPRITGSGDAQFRDLTLWTYLDRARNDNPNVKMFVDYLQKCIKTAPDDPLSTTLDGISAAAFYTILMPSNTAMSAAISAGVLPPIDSVVATKPEYFAKAAFFINSHILQGRALMDDNIRGYIYPVNPMSPNEAILSVKAKVNSEALGLTNQSLLIGVSKAANGLINFTPRNVAVGARTLVTGGTSGTIRIARGKPAGSTKENDYRSNRIACRAVLHEVNGYITYKVAE